MRKKNRLLISAAFLISMFFLVGWGTKPVELLDKKELLINLDAAIKNADLGKEGSEAALKGEKEETEREGISGSETKTQNEVEEANKTYQIIVQVKTIKFEGKVCKDMEELKNAIIQNCSKESEVSLQDDYAEAHVYREVKEVIEDLQNEIGFSFSSNM